MFITSFLARTCLSNMQLSWCRAAAVSTCTTKGSGLTCVWLEGLCECLCGEGLVLACVEQGGGKGPTCCRRAQLQQYDVQGGSNLATSHAALACRPPAAIFPHKFPFSVESVGSPEAKWQHHFHTGCNSIPWYFRKFCQIPVGTTCYFCVLLCPRAGG